MVLENQPDAFPELRYSHLSIYAKEWAKAFPEISRIVLYRYSTPPHLVIHPDRATIPVKFAVILEARGENAAGFKELQNATGYLVTAKIKGTLRAFIKDASFPSTVYREEPSGEFWREWMFIAVRPDEGVPSASVCTTRPRWVLYDSFPDRMTSGAEQDEGILTANNYGPGGGYKKGFKGVFPCETNTPWEKVKITLIAEDAVRVSTPLGEGRFSYHELGFSDKRVGNRPNVLWGLLKVFAQNQGKISPAESQFTATLRDTSKRLNKHLQTLFGIRESIYVAPYRKARAYKTRILFSDQTSVLA